MCVLRPLQPYLVSCSCANSWIEDARYGTPAEKTLQWTAYTALVRAGRRVGAAGLGGVPCLGPRVAKGGARGCASARLHYRMGPCHVGCHSTDPALASPVICRRRAATRSG